METPTPGLTPVGKVVERALEACSNPTEVIRQAREGFLEKVASRNAERVARRQLPRLRPWRLVLAGFAMLAIAAGVHFGSARPITFHIGTSAATGRTGDLIEAPTSGTVPVHFSEGSYFVLQGGGRARVLATEGRGARVLVDRGDMDVTIAHPNRKPGRWNFEAGPFHVLVTGTKFHMAWNPTIQRFSLATTEGRVVVTSTCMPTAKIIAAGDHAELSCPPDMASPTAPPAETRPSAGPSEMPAAASAPNTSPAKALPKASPWRERIAAGRITDGLHAAEVAGFGRVCQEASLKELIALADAARLSGRSARATEALRSLRQRFPHTMEASTAAFTLGRIAFEQRSAYAEAATWFRVYLSEQPTGPLMGDSVGRLMEARQRGGDMAGARQDAERYLRRFPEGPYASEARAILQK